VVVLENENRDQNIENNVVAIYCRVSDNASKDNLERQAERLEEYAIVRGYKIRHLVMEIGSGVNDMRLINLLNLRDYNVLLVEYKDRLTRFGFNYIKFWLESTERKVEVANDIENSTQDLIQDLFSIIYSFSVRLYGLRKAKNKAGQIMEVLQNES
jgi:predicted site-specific integrase-resolvase